MGLTLVFLKYAVFKVVETHIIFADVTDEGLGFAHGSWCWSEHRESFLVHLTYCHTLRGKTIQHSVKVCIV